MFTINCKGKLLTIDEPLVMGIINSTPDSFYAASTGKSIDDIMGMVKQMINEGAAIIDIGGQSTKPFSQPVSVEEELKRVIPVIKKVYASFPEIIISVDTFYSNVAIEAVSAGASIVNDISAGELDEKMIATIAALKVPYVCMHMQGTPATMQKNPSYDHVVNTVLNFFIEKVDACQNAGITDIIIDPGFGFGKTTEQNFTLLHGLSVFQLLKKPILAGLSRKSIVSKTLNITAEKSLNGTTVLNTIALLNGATILRVHDVNEAREAINLISAYKKKHPFIIKECFNYFE